MKNLAKVFYTALMFSAGFTSAYAGASQAEKTTPVKSTVERYASFRQFGDVKETVIPSPRPSKRLNKSRDTEQAVEPSGTDGRVVVVKQDLRKLIQLAATRSRMNADVSRGVRGTVQNASLSGNFTDMLDTLAETYDIVWYRKNRNVFVSSSIESKSRLIFLGETSFKRFKDSVNEAGIIAPSFEFEYLRDAQSVSLVGPISYLASLELIAQALSKSTGSASVVTIKAGVVDTIKR